MKLNRKFFYAVESFPGLPVPSRAKSYVMGADPKGQSFLYCTEKAVIIRDIVVGTLISRPN